MVLVSLGFACKVRESIDRYLNSRGETQIFDWLLTNFSTVIHVLNNIDNPKVFLNKDMFTNQGIFPNNKSNFFVSHKNIYFNSLHDFPSEISYGDYMNKFIEKYSRRLKRLKRLIINSKETIQFIHMFNDEKCIPTIDEIYSFLNIIKKLNSNCKFYLHILVAPENHKYYEKINILKICANVKIHYMKSKPDIEPNKEQRCDLNWNEIYSSLD